jgi:hypothetical protein
VVENNFVDLKKRVYIERKFMNEDTTKPATGTPAPATSVETKPADQKPAAPVAK